MNLTHFFPSHGAPQPRLIGSLNLIPIRQCEPQQEDLLYEESCSMETGEWRLAFDVHPLTQVVGEELDYILSMAPIFLLLSSSNSCVPITKIGWGFDHRAHLPYIQELVAPAQGDSKLIIKQVNGVLSLKEIALEHRRTAVQKLIRPFSPIQFKHMRRAHNMNALVTLESKIDIPNEGIDVSITKKTLRASRANLIPTNTIEEQSCAPLSFRILLSLLQLWQEGTRPTSLALIENFTFEAVMALWLDL